MDKYIRSLSWWKAAGLAFLGCFSPGALIGFLILDYKEYLESNDEKPHG